MSGNWGSRVGAGVLPLALPGLQGAEMEGRRQAAKVSRWWQVGVAKGLQVVGRCAGVLPLALPGLRGGRIKEHLRHYKYCDMS